MDKRSYFDLQQRSHLAVNCLTELLDKEQGCLPYFDALYWTKPPLAQHIRWDYGDCTGRYVDALTLMRIMSGSQLNVEVDGELERLLFSFLGVHGLSYWPAPPYQTSNPSDSPGEVAELCWSQASTLHALTTLYRASEDVRYRETGARLIDGLAEIALSEGGMRFFPVEAARGVDILYRPGGWTDGQMSRAGWFGTYVGVLIYPLVRFYEATGYEPAARLAHGFSEYVLRGARVFRADGRFYDLLTGHFYGRVVTALGLLRCGLVHGKSEYVEMAENIYIHAKEWGTRFGWFPEDLNTADGCETCCVTNMIELAIILGSHVDSIYWNDAECFGRNQLLENQLLRIDWTDRLAEDSSRVPLSDPVRITRERVMERMRGGFAGWSGINDWVSRDVRFRHMMGCCNAHGARGLYDLWHYAVTQSRGEVSVNMLFTRANSEVELISYLPYEGRVEVRAKAAKSFRVRIPTYVDRKTMTVTLNGATRQHRFSGNWLQLGDLRAGDLACIRFDLPERVEQEFLGYDTYRIKYRGDTITEVDPQGSVYPIYDRKELLKSEGAEVANPTLADRLEVDSI